MTSFRLVLAYLASLTVGPVLGQAQPQMKMASEACVSAVDPQKLVVLVESSSRIARNVLSLQQGMRADDSDYEGANDLWRVSSDLSTLLQWMYFTLRHSRSTNTLSRQAPLPSMLMPMPRFFRMSVNSALVNWLP